ncbi:MAG: glycoside hydrolase family 3 N-terminal domain-containing protein [Bacteroidota bacterium]
MKQFLRILKRLGIGLLLLVLLVIGFFYAKWKWVSHRNHSLLGDRALILTVDGYSYRDLNKNGQLDPYEDKRLPTDLRLDDLVSQMTLEEKAGAMFITMAAMNEDGYYNEYPIFSEPITFMLESNTTMIARKLMNHFNIIQSPSSLALANWNNHVQALAEQTRLGIPITVASDPRHVAGNNVGASIVTPFFSRWASPLGFAAIGDTVLMRRFGDIARQEYLGVGIRLALSPMADLGTEPRWGRFGGTFGEDAALSAKLTKAYILGFQGDSLNHSSVACMSKHFSGGGPQKDGEDAHFPYGQDQAYPGDNFDYHLIPFRDGVFPANTASIMPYYGVPVGQTSEDVGFAYNKEIISDLLLDSFQFKGVVCTDWGLITESKIKPPAAWGVEHLSEIERVEKILDAGCDMFGGESCVNYIIELVNSGRISEERIDRSVRKIMRDKFVLGLFDDPYVPLEDLQIVGQDAFWEAGKESQRRSLTLLKNDGLLPLKKNIKVYLSGLYEPALESFAQLVDSPAEADVIIQKIATPFDPRSEYLLENFFHQGRLHYTESELAPILELAKQKPTITIVTIERPPILSEIAAASSALIADFNSQDDIIFGMLFGDFAPEGKLPFELPSSIEAVENQKEDMPYDSKDPLYPFGHGLSYD